MTCFAGAALLSSAIAYREWSHRNPEPISVGELICRYRRVDLAQFTWRQRLDAVRDCRAIAEWATAPAEAIEPEDMAQVLMVREEARHTKALAVRSLFLPKMGYIEQSARAFQSLTDDFTDLIANVAPRYGPALKLAL